MALLQERRFEEALNVLYASREHAPGNPSISRAIHVLKDRLMDQYRRQLGSMDRVPVRLREDAAATSDERAVVVLVDGVATVADVMECCNLGHFRTMQVLLGLANRGVLGLGPNGAASPSAPPAAEPLAEDIVSLLSESSGRILTPGTMAAVNESFSGLPAGTSRAPTPSHGLHPTLPMAAVPAREQPSPVPTRPAADPAPADDPYESLFSSALKAYLVRDYAEAERLFLSCAERRPADGRVHHNLRKLRERSIRP